MRKVQTESMAAILDVASANRPKKDRIVHVP
jgi:hypothetical protein